MAVTRLDLSNFRTYRALRLECGPRPVVLVGANGAGKTNLLEALSLLAPGRGLRRARLSELDRREPADSAAGPVEPWSVAARLSSGEGEIRLGTGRDPAKGPERRLVRIDGEPARTQTTLARYLTLVWLTPQMDRLFQEGAGARRRFLDRLVFGFDPEHAGRLGAYEHALRERSQLLREHSGDAAWLGRLERDMAENGVAVAAARVETVQLLGRMAALDAGLDDRQAFPVPEIGLSGAVEGWIATMPALAAEERFAAELAASRRLDAAASGALVGPHRSDLLVRHKTKGMAAEHCSTGEQKALLIAVILAQVRAQIENSGARPILLMDEIAAHLDRPRRQALFEAILAQGCQAWLTGTDPEAFAPLAGAAQFFTVADGSIYNGCVG